MRPQSLSNSIKFRTELSSVEFFSINFSLNLWKAFSNFLEATHFCQFWGNNSLKSSCWSRSFNFALLSWSRTLGRSFLQMSANATHSSDSVLFRLCDLTGKINSSQFYFWFWLHVFLLTGFEKQSDSLLKFERCPCDREQSYDCSHYMVDRITIS